MNRLERMKLLGEYNNLRRTIESGMNRIDRMRSLGRINQIRTLLGASLQDNPAIAFLRSVIKGASDNLGLSGLLDKIGISIFNLQKNNELVGEIEDLADDAITHWAQLEQNTPLGAS